jgi:hypothetical protein
MRMLLLQSSRVFYRQTVYGPATLGQFAKAYFVATFAVLALALLALALATQSSFAQADATPSQMHVALSKLTPVKINSYWVQDDEDIRFSILAPLEFFSQTLNRDDQSSDILNDFLLDWLRVSQMNQFCSLRNVERPRAIDRFQTQIRGTFHCLNNETPISIRDTKVGDVNAIHTLLIRHARANPDTIKTVRLLKGQTKFEFDIGSEGKINARGPTMSSLQLGFSTASTNFTNLVLSVLLLVSLLIRLRSPIKQYLIVASFLLGQVIITSNTFLVQDIAAQTGQIFLGGLILFYCVLNISHQLRIGHWISFTLAALIFLFGLLPLPFIVMIPDGTWAGAMLFFVCYGLWSKDHPYKAPEVAAFRPSFALTFGVLSALILLGNTKPEWALQNQHSSIEWGLTFGVMVVVLGTLFVFKAIAYIVSLASLNNLKPQMKADISNNKMAPSAQLGISDALAHNIVATLLATLGSYMTLSGILS